MSGWRAIRRRRRAGLRLQAVEHIVGGRLELRAEARGGQLLRPPVTGAIDASISSSASSAAAASTCRWRNRDERRFGFGQRRLVGQRVFRAAAAQVAHRFGDAGEAAAAIERGQAPLRLRDMRPESADLGWRTVFARSAPRPVRLPARRSIPRRVGRASRRRPRSPRSRASPDRRSAPRPSRSRAPSC